MSTVHVLPVNDLIEHVDIGDDCPCGPTAEPVEREDGSYGWVITHHSLDGREAHENDNIEGGVMVGPLRPYEKWFYPSIVLWLLAACWLLCVVVPEGVFVKSADAIVGVFLTAAASVTAVVAYALSRRGQ